MHRKLEQKEDAAWLPQAEKPQLFQIRQQGKQEKLGLSLKSAPQPGSTLLQEPEGRAHWPCTQTHCRLLQAGPRPLACTLLKTRPENPQVLFLSPCQRARSFPLLPSAATLKGGSAHCTAGAHKDFFE